MTAAQLHPLPSEITQLDLPQLCDHLVDTHHVYIREQGPIILDLLAQVDSKYNNHSQLKQIQLLFSKMYQGLIQHLPKEEQVLFPMCKQIAAASGPMMMHCGSLSNPIGAMEYEHEIAESELKELRTLTQDYLNPETDDPVMKKLYQALKDFDADLVLHMHKENNLLFPRILDREKALS